VQRVEVVEVVGRELAQGALGVERDVQRLAHPQPAPPSAAAANVRDARSACGDIAG